MTSRRSFLKCLIGGVAATALPASAIPAPAAATTAPATSVADALMQAAMGNIAPGAEFLRVTGRQSNSILPEIFIYKLDPAKWQIGGGRAAYMEEIVFACEDAAVVEGYEIVNRQGIVLARETFDWSRPLHQGDMLHMNLVASVDANPAPAPEWDPDLPTDWREPEWGTYDKVHGWRNYITDEVQALWPTFTDEQKRALARQAWTAADNEEWD